MVTHERLKQYRSEQFHPQPTAMAADLGPLQHLPGRWRNAGVHAQGGWRMTAHPLDAEPGKLNYTLQVDQFEEELTFARAPADLHTGGGASAALDYRRTSRRIADARWPDEGALDVEPAHRTAGGTWLYRPDAPHDVARIGAIPQGDAVLAPGRSSVIDGAPDIPPVNSLPLGVGSDLGCFYLAPYRHFDAHPFKGRRSASAAGFTPLAPESLLVQALPDNVRRTTRLHVDTRLAPGSIRNLPINTRRSNALELAATLWIMELDARDADGAPKLVLAYMKVVVLEFFARRDGAPGLIRWPQLTINILEKVSGPGEKAAMPRG